MFDWLNSETESEEFVEPESGVWLSIGDLMSGLLLFFALLFIATQIQLQKKSEELQQYQEAFQNLPLLVKQAVDAEQALVGDSIQIDPETGDVKLEAEILFDEGSAQLNQKGKAFLQDFIPIYSQVIFSKPEFERQIVRVIIEGHTSSKGSEAANQVLALERALSVTNYIFSDELDFPNKERFKQKILAAGRGEFDANQERDDPRDRQVIFRFQLRQPDLSNFLLEEQSLQESLERRNL